MTGVNLLPRTRVRAEARRARVRAWTFVLAPMALATLAAAVVGHAMREGSTLTITETKLTDLETRIEGLKRDLRQEEARRKGALDRLALLDSVAHHPNWSRLLTLIAEARGESILLERCQIEPVFPPAPTGKAAAGQDTSTVGTRPVRYTVTVGGVSGDALAVSDYVLALERRGIFDSVAQREVRPRSVRGVEGVAFTIECTLLELRGAKP